MWEISRIRTGSIFGTGDNFIYFFEGLDKNESKQEAGGNENNEWESNFPGASEKQKLSELYPSFNL